MNSCLRNTLPFISKRLGVLGYGWRWGMCPFNLPEGARLDLNLAF